MTTESPDFPGFDQLREVETAKLDRREFLGFIGATLAASACGEMADDASSARAYPTIDSEPAIETSPPPPAPDLPGNPFQLGVACGDPLPDGFVLWTRLAPDPLADGGGMPEEDVPVVWELARDPNFDDVVGEDWLYAEPSLVHSVHVDVRGLRPDRWYWYRFRVGEEWTSSIGRARTFPRHDSLPERFRMATASCQKYTDGYYTAHAHLAREELDLVAFLGDYIYEYGGGGDVRDHPGPYLRTLDEFRQRYALYKTDSDLQASHANCPWVFTWDDHEVRNNYAGDESHKGRVDDFKSLRASAYQAYYEHMPLRVPLPDDPSSLRIYRSLRFGDLVRLYVLDGRQYRSGVVCEGEIDPPCDEAFDPEGTMLGRTQFDWLVEQLDASETVWNAICQQTVFSPTNLDNAIINADQWDGYQVERQRLLDVFASDPTRNITVLTGDIHAAAFSTLPADDDAPEESETVGHEIITTSISSGSSTLEDFGDASALAGDLLPHIKYLNPGYRGYCLLEYTREKCTVQYRAVSTVQEPEAEVTTDNSFVIEATKDEQVRNNAG